MAKSCILVPAPRALRYSTALLLALLLLALSVDQAVSDHSGKLMQCTFLLVRFLYYAREHCRRAVEQVDENWVLCVCVTRQRDYS